MGYAVPLVATTENSSSLTIMFKKFIRDEKGAALLEYSLLAAGVALVSAAAVSVFGHKTSDLLGAVATVMPGAHADDNGPIVSAKIIETTGADTGPIQVDAAGIVLNTDSPRLGNNFGLGLGVDGNNGFGGLVLEAE